MRSGETLLRDGLDYVARARPVRFRAFVPLRGNGVGTACKARGIRVGTTWETRLIWRQRALDLRKRNVRPRRYTEKHGFDPAAWCLSLSLF